jgi:hypothetical protein
MLKEKELTIECPSCKNLFAFSDEILAKSFKEEIRNETEKKLEIEREKLARSISLEKSKELEKFKQNALKEATIIVEKQFLEKKAMSEIKVEALKEQNDKLLNELSEMRKNINSLLKEKQKSSLELEQTKQEQLFLIEKAVLESKEDQKRQFNEQIKREIEKVKMDKDLSLKEKEQELKELQKKIESLKNANNDSRIRGEAFEIFGEKILENFAKEFNDKVVEIKKGQNGSDNNYIVLTENGNIAGQATIEFKRVDVFQNNFIKKALEDMKREGSALGVICSTTLPRSYSDAITIVEDKLFIMGPSEFKHFIKILRKMILDDYRAKLILTSNKDFQLKDRVFNFITSKEFISQINTTYKRLVGLSNGIEKDYRRIEVSLKKRKQECDDTIEGIVETYLGLHKVAPSQLPALKSFELTED